MLKLYWFIGSEIIKKQETSNWGDGLLKQISDDLKAEFPEMKGFSHRNIKYIKQWFVFWNNANRQQLVPQLEKEQILAIFQIPWGHNLVIISKSKSSAEAIYYVNKTIENNWSRTVLIHQIESQLYERQGKAISNFENRLPEALEMYATMVYVQLLYNFSTPVFTGRTNTRKCRDCLMSYISCHSHESGNP